MIFKALLQWYEDGLYCEMETCKADQLFYVLFLSILINLMNFSFKPICTMDTSKMLSFYDTIADLFTEETLYTKNLHYFFINHVGFEVKYLSLPP